LRISTTRKRRHSAVGYLTPVEHEQPAGAPIAA
jgi:hypothetical protein